MEHVAAVHDQIDVAGQRTHHGAFGVGVEGVPVTWALDLGS